MSWSQVSASSSHESVVQGFESAQSRAAPPQVPSEQRSSVVQKLPSSQRVALVVCSQAPVSALHESSVHELSSSQDVASPPWQTPPPQVSPLVQAEPSSQVVPSSAL